jgi:hypothetical protein
VKKAPKLSSLLWKGSRVNHSGVLSSYRTRRVLSRDTLQPCYDTHGIIPNKNKNSTLAMYNNRISELRTLSHPRHSSDDGGTGYEDGRVSMEHEAGVGT